MFVEAGPGLAAARAALEACAPAASTSEMLEQIRALEELRGLLAATQATVTAAYVAARRVEQRAAGVPAKRVGLGIAHEVGIARRESPFRAGRYAGWATILTSELPCTLASLRAGRTSEWRAMLVGRETGWLAAEHRGAVDAELGPRLESMGDREVEAETRRLAYRLGPGGLVERFARAARGRRVGLRPEPDGMTRLTALLPLTQGVATLAALDAAAGSARAAGDARGRGQVMADTLVQRVTGQASANAVPLRVNLIMTDQALVADGATADEPVVVSGHGPIPAAVARRLLTQSADNADNADNADDAEHAGSAENAAAAAGAASAGRGLVELRRLFTDPAGRLVSMETSGRFFTRAQAAFVRLRDQRCRNPWCGAPIRQIDHIEQAARGGGTSLANARGLCEACNHAREAPGWRLIRLEDGTTRVVTPTGLSARTDAATATPRIATRRTEDSRRRSRPAPERPSQLEQRLARQLRRARGQRPATVARPQSSSRRRRRAVGYAQTPAP